LTVETDKRRIIFEFKYAENNSDAKTKLNEAIEQIKTRDYGNILPPKELIRIAAVFMPSLPLGQYRTISLYRLETLL
ncbi:MAG: PD-(D/E)XK nuclease domain-containing protein, partial [Succinivibrio sp.]